jgi:hypothetical protein
VNNRLINAGLERKGDKEFGLRCGFPDIIIIMISLDFDLIEKYRQGNTLTIFFFGKVKL